MIEGSMKRNSKSNWLQNPRARMFSQKKKTKQNNKKQTNKKLYMQLSLVCTWSWIPLRNFSIVEMFLSVLACHTCLFDSFHIWEPFEEVSVN